MAKETVRLTEEKLKEIIETSIRKKLREGFEQDFNNARDNYFQRKPHGLFGMEMKNPQGDWEYGDVTFDPRTNKMSCMGVSIDVDPDCTVDQNLEALYEELVNQGYTDDDE